MEMNHSDERIRHQNEMRKQVEEIKWIWMILYSCLWIIILLLNSLVIFIFFIMSKIRQKIPNYLLFVQAAIDICYGIKIFFDVLPAYSSSLNHLAESLAYHTSKAFLGDMIQYVSIGNLIMTSLERFIALRKPLFHRTYVTRKGVICGTVILIIASAVPCSAFAYIQNCLHTTDEYKDRADLIFYIFDNSLIISSILLVQTLLLMTYLTIRSSIKQKLKEAKANIRLNRNKSRYYSETIVNEGKKESRVVRLFMAIAAVYFLTFLPTSIFNIVIETGGDELRRNFGPIQFMRVQIGLFVLLFSSAIFDPLLTLYLKHDYRDTLVNFVRKRGRLGRSYSQTEL